MGSDILGEKGDRLLFLMFCPRVDPVLFLTEKVACPLFLAPRREEFEG